MSATWPLGPAPDALELAALLCSRVCRRSHWSGWRHRQWLRFDENLKPEHPTGVDRPARAPRPPWHDETCRLAFGAAGSAGAQIDLGDAQNMARGHIEDGKITTVANYMPVAAEESAKPLLNMLVIAIADDPRGGTPTIDPVGDGDERAASPRLAKGPLCCNISPTS